MNSKKNTEMLPENLIKKIKVQFIKMQKSKQIGSVISVHNQTSAFIGFINFVAENCFLVKDINDQNISLNHIINNVDREMGILYLNQLKSEFKSRKWQDTVRLAINNWLQYSLNLIVSGKSKVQSKKRKNLRKIIQRYQKIRPSDIELCNMQKQLTLSYTDQQTELIRAHVNKRNSFSIMLCRELGIRVHELLTIKPIELQPPTQKKLSSKQQKAVQYKFVANDSLELPNGKFYTVKGKGGLIRVIYVPYHLAIEIEKRRLKKPRYYRDREAIYWPIYDLAGGNNLSSSFTKASQRHLGWSNGIHALRHDYCKARLKTLFNLFGDYELARRIVSQELGHFRPQITNSYCT